MPHRLSRSQGAYRVGVLALCLGLAAGASHAQGEASAASDGAPPAERAEQPVEAAQPGAESAVRPDRAHDGNAYPVSSIDLVYTGFAAGDLRLPDPGLLREVAFVLVPTEEGLVGPREGVEGVVYTCDTLCSEGAVVLFGSAIREIGRAVSAEVLRSADIMGVYAVPSFEQIARDGTDVRDTDTSLTVEIHAGAVSELRTIASGPRIPFEDRLDSGKHARIRRNSPVTPSIDGGPAAFIPASRLEGYLHRLNRHPGRRVELAVSPGEGQDEAVLDYLVYENKPWRLHAQISNTGTEQTNEWRERFGLVHSQLTGRDDIFSLDYMTAGFEDTHAVAATYDTPLGVGDRLRGRLAVSWSEFSASDVGEARQSFTGDSSEIGGDLVYNLFQHRDLFVDVLAGARLFRTEIDNTTAGQKGEQAFFVPRVGVEVERYRDTSTLSGSVEFEWSMSGVTGVSDAELVNLGRFDPDRSWEVLRAGLGYSFYLEPLLRDDFVPGQSMLAHEIALSTRGQWAMGHRLIPVEQQVAGGLYSVRGYPESIAAGDSVFIGSAEYRFHLPRALSPGAPRKEVTDDQFRWRPTQAGEAPDWDLLARGFLDVARTVQSDRNTDFEFNETLIGTGLGLELIVRRNLSLRADWGIALKDMDSGEVTAGSSRFHLSATFVY